LSRDTETEDDARVATGLDAELDTDAASAGRSPLWRRPLDWLRSAGQFFFLLTFSSLTRRIVSLNLASLIALVASILYLSQFRAGL
ncbi:UNVERIFIED_CONTAM: sensor N-terminal transmembrane domain-containing protein, partial [Prevotella sp. 15_C9]